MIVCHECVIEAFLTAIVETGRVHAVLELFNRMRFTDVSKDLSRSMLDKSVDIMDEYEGSDEEQPRRLRRSTRKPSRSKATRGPQPGDPHREKIYRDLLRDHARTYFELGELAAAMDALWKWRATEDKYFE